MNNFIWEPSGDYLNCKVKKFMELHKLASIEDLIQKSIDDSSWFWENAMEFMGFQWQKKYSQLTDPKDNIAFTKWFINGELNITANCLDYHVQPAQATDVRPRAGANALALIWENEAGQVKQFTYKEISVLADKIARALLYHGYKMGDSVAIYMPMTIEMIAIFFGCLKVGVIVIPIFSGYGAQAIAARLNDAKAKAIFTVNASHRKGKLINLKTETDEAIAISPSIKHLIVVNHVPEAKTNLDNKTNIWFADFINVPDQASINININTKAEHESLYLYTSGTTGAPKACVHTHAGALAQISKEHGFCFDVSLGDVFFWITDLGWMMGPWKVIGALFWGGTIMLYEGAPNHPNSNHLFKIIEKYKVNILGISPTLIRTLKGASDLNIEEIELFSLKYLGAAGEPFDEDSYMWFFNHVGKGKCPVVNFSGGTEVIGGFLTPYPLIPCKPCSLGYRGLGMDATVFDENGQEVFNTVGHLVCRKPAPSMTKGFLNAQDRYLETYFSKFPGAWYHGDWAKIDENGFWFLYGRSDDTIKIAGKRLGPSEVEAILTNHENVIEAAVIGVPDPIKGEAIVCFVVLKNKDLNINIQNELNYALAEQLGHSFRPKEINTVKALPKTRSGKIVRKTIKQKYLAYESIDLSSIENPEALEYIVPTVKV